MSTLKDQNISNASPFLSDPALRVTRQRPLAHSETRSIVILFFIVLTVFAVLISAYVMIEERVEEKNTTLTSLNKKNALLESAKVVHKQWQDAQHNNPDILKKFTDSKFDQSMDTPSLRRSLTEVCYRNHAVMLNLETTDSPAAKDVHHRNISLHTYVRSKQELMKLIQSIEKELTGLVIINHISFNPPDATTIINKLPERQANKTGTKLPKKGYLGIVKFDSIHRKSPES